MPEEAGQDLEGFMEIAEGALSHTRWIAIFDAVGKGTLDDKEGVTQFILGCGYCGGCGPSRVRWVQCKTKIVTGSAQTGVRWRGYTNESLLFVTLE